MPPADWMSALDDARPLHTLTLPGSHDTCAYTVDDRLVRTQRAPLDAQLAHGVRLRRFRSGRPLGIDLTAWPDNATFTIDHPDGAFVIQDEYRVPIVASIGWKWRAIDALLTHLPLPESGRWAINFCSGTGMGANPSVVAHGDGRVQGIHARLAERLREQRGPHGAMLLDFCDDDDWALVRALIACNDHAPASGVWRKAIRC